MFAQSHVNLISHLSHLTAVHQVPGGVEHVVHLCLSSPGPLQVTSGGTVGKGFPFYRLQRLGSMGKYQSQARKALNSLPSVLSMAPCAESKDVVLFGV